MSTSLPPLALEMSMDGIALHQLAFDGHWHEMSRISLDDAALPEKMASMRAAAVKLYGRNVTTRIWLPEDQVINRDISLAGSGDSARISEAQQKIAGQTPYNPSDFQVILSETDQEGSVSVTAVRKSTLNEARVFAKSHGFNGTVYATRAAPAGFVDHPHFTLPADAKRIAKFGLIAASVALLVVTIGFAFSALDWQSWWYSSPRVEDVAPYRGSDIAPDNSAQNILPLGSERPPFSDIAMIPANTAHESEPISPDAPSFLTAQIDTQIPSHLEIDALEVDPHKVWTTATLPLTVGQLAPASALDLVPNFGPINPTIRIAAPSDLEAEPLALVAFSIDPVAARVAKPGAMAAIQFSIASLPPLLSRMSPTEIDEVSNSFDIPLAELGATTPVISLISLPPVSFIAGLPPFLPRLRNGQAIPEQTPIAEPVQPLPVVASGIQAIAGAPRPRPILRPAPVPDVVVEIPVANEGLQVISGRPTFTLRHRPAPPEPVIVPEPVVEVVEIVNQPEIIVPTSTDIDIESNGLEIVQGLPTRMPLLRSGDEIPEQQVAMLATVDVANLTPEMIEAIRLRPLRRPQSIVEMPAPADPMRSDAAPATVLRPEPRNESFNLNAARIAELLANRPRSNAPPVPVDPPSINLPTTASVAREATIENGINLRKTSLIGIIGTNDARRAIIRLSGGRFVRVQIGESFSGWRVVAIGENSVRIQKGRREEILRLP